MYKRGLNFFLKSARLYSGNNFVEKLLKCFYETLENKGLALKKRKDFFFFCFQNIYNLK
jgi:hypothetical protein